MNEGAQGDVTTRRNLVAGGRVEGGVRIRLRDDDGVTRLAELWHHDPMRVLLPEPIDDALPHVVLLNTSGGLVGGDTLDVKVTLGARARALVTGQAAEKLYRSAGADVRVDNHLEIGEGGWLEWLPQETILFDRSRLRRRLTLDLAATARALAGELLVFGRRARGEIITELVLHDAWIVRRAGRLVWTDALRLDRDVRAILASPFTFAGAAAMATLVYAAPDAHTQLEPVREVLAEEQGMAATSLGEILLVRGLATDVPALRRSFARVWCLLRSRAGGLPARLPRLWHI